MAYLGQSFSQGPARVNPAVLYFDAANLLFLPTSVDGQFKKPGWSFCINSSRL